MSLQDGDETQVEKTDYNNESYLKEENSSSDADLAVNEQEVGDTALANSPWKYKIVALITALSFPRKSKEFFFFLNHLFIEI